jgi:hypothetical protein
LTKTNLQISGPSHGRSKPSTMEQLYTLSWRLTPFLWQEIDEGILPALYAATSPQAEGGAFYGPAASTRPPAVGWQPPSTRAGW